MRWEALFADLAAQADALARAERDQEIAERYRIESGAVALAARLAASVGRRLRLCTLSGLVLTGSLDQVGANWLLLAGASGAESVVVTSGLLSVRGLDRGAVTAPPSAVQERLGVRSILRALARQRSALVIDLADGSALRGVIDRVGSDYVDLSVVTGGRPRDRDPSHRDEQVAVPLAGLVAVTRQPAHDW